MRFYLKLTDNGEKSCNCHAKLANAILRGIALHLIVRIQLKKMKFQHYCQNFDITVNTLLQPTFLDYANAYLIIITLPKQVISQF